MINIKFKRGDTFRIGAAVAEGTPSAPKDLTGFGVRASLKDRTTLVADLTVDWTDRTGGTFDLVAEATATAAWPTKTLLCDIEYTDPDGTVLSTETFEVSVIADVTTP